MPLTYLRYGIEYTIKELRVPRVNIVEKGLA